MEEQNIFQSVSSENVNEETNKSTTDFPSDFTDNIEESVENTEQEIIVEKPVYNRDTAFDIIKIAAVFLVVSVHFFLNNGFYSQPVVGNSMYIAVLMRTFFGMCVPLFMVCTGYIMTNKELSAKYYLGIKKVLLSYFISCIACFIFSIVYLKEQYTIKHFFFKVLDFSAAPYAWYVEMYIGIFLLIPFLNLAYHNLKSQKHKAVLVWTMIILTVIPSIFNIYNFDTAEWWSNPSSSDQFQKLFPSWWMGIYPITYYYIGSYLREYGLKFKTGTLALLLAIATVVFGSFNYYRSYSVGFITSVYQYWYGFQPCFMTVLFFALLQRIKANNLPISLRKFLAKISNMTLMIYLVSFIFDKVYYPKLTESVPLMADRVKYYFVLVIPVFVSSVCLSAVLTEIQNIIIKLVKSLAMLLKKYERTDILRSQTFWYTILMGAAIIFAFHKAPLGFGGNDEPFYLTVAHRLSLGDALFRDEWHLSQMSGFLTMPFVALYRLINQSTDGIILATRYTYLIVHAIVSIFAYNRLRKYGFMAIAASILYFIFTPYDIMALSYNTMALDLLVLSGLLLATFKATRTVPFVLSGLAFAGAVLCCPYLVSGYVLYAICFILAFILRRVNHCPRLLKSFIFNGRVFMKFTFGVAGLTIAFFGFLLTRIHITEIFDNLPYMLEDPEHPRISFMDKMRYYFKFTYECHPQFKISFRTYAIVLAAMIIDRNRRNHRSFYLLCTLAITFFSYMLFVPKMTTVYYNALIFPMFFVGITSYILCKKKPRTLFATLFVIGIVYSVCVCNTSNQYFYVISMASAICNIASMIFLGVLLKEIKQKPDKVAYSKILANVSLVASCFIILLLSYFEIDTKASHCFWEPQPVSVLSQKIVSGPAKGIYTTPENALSYETVYKDLKDAYRGKPADNILIMSERTWCYLALNNYDYGTYSAWLSGEKDLTLNRLQKFYNLNPDKKPKYIFLPKDTKWDFNKVLNDLLNAGYTYKETDVSYQLELTN